MGQVSWVVVPNRWHHIHAAAMKARYPDAQVIGPASANLRNKSVALDVAIDDQRLASLIPELSPLALRGVPFLDETLFFHAETRTLIGADLMMCGCPADHWTVALGFSRVWPVSALQGEPGCALAYARRTDRTKASLEEIAKLPLERILVAHSDPIEDRPIEQLEEAWRFARR